MKPKILIKWAALGALVGWHGLLQAAVTAMLLDVKGQASVTYSGRTSAAQIATSLQEDTKVEVAAGGQVSLVHYATREQFTVSGPASIMITPKGVEPISGTPGKSRKLAEPEAKVAIAYSGRVLGALNMRRPGDAIELFYPRDGETIIDASRAIAWKADDADAPVLVKLFAGDRLVGERSVRGTSLAPARLGALTAGSVYRVEVSALNQKPVKARFTLARPEQRDLLIAMKPKDQTSVEDWVMYAMALEADAVVSEAKEAWAVVATLRPEAAGLVRRMAR